MTVLALRQTSRGRTGSATSYIKAPATTDMAVAGRPEHVTDAVTPSCVGVGCEIGVAIGLVSAGLGAGETWALGATPGPQAMNTSPANESAVPRLQPMLLR